MSDDTTHLSEQVARLEARLQLVEDRQAIVDCLHRYSRGLDRHDRAILRSVYHDGGVDHHGPFTGDADDFVPWADELLASEWDAHLHVLDVNHVDIDGDEAHTETYVFFSQRRRDSAVVDIGAGRYIDRLQRRDGDWRVIFRELVIEWMGRAETTWFGGGSEYPTGKWSHADRSYDRPFTVPEP